MCVVQMKSDNCENLQENLRMKRSKYYHYPQRFYRPPPHAYPIKGPYSYTPPPNYTVDERPATLSRPPKVSRPEGLGDDDISNLVKYLSKTDLDKIIEFAGEKESEYRPSYKRPKVRVQEIDDEKFSLNGPFLNPVRPELNEQSYVRDIHSNPERTSYDSNSNVNYINDDSQPKLIYSRPPDTENYNPTYLNSPLEPQETRVSYQLSNSPNVYQSNNVVKDTYMDKEEQLPKPVNLREYEEYQVSFTNNVPSVVKADSSYKLENFGELPVMNYQNSKLHSVSSYNVPQYTVSMTDGQKYFTNNLL